MKRKNPVSVSKKTFANEPAARKALSRRPMGSYVAWDTGKRRWVIVTPKKNPKVYDSAGKLFGKFKRKSAPIIARAIGGSVGKKKNPAPVRALKGRAKSIKIVRKGGQNVLQIRGFKGSTK